MRNADHIRRTEETRNWKTDVPFRLMSARVLEQSDFQMQFPARLALSPAMGQWNRENGIALW